jgi:ankyrin repeat protein
MGYEMDNFKDGDCAVECLKYLKSIGVDTKLKDAEGKTAIEIASDSTIIAYLKSI